MAGSEDSQTNDRELVTLVLEAQAEERERVASELHDETGQTLTALLVGLRALENDLDGAQRERVADLREQVRALIGKVGRLARGLHPAMLGELSLAEVIERQATEFGEASGIAVSVEFVGPERLDELAPAAALAVYRLVQEGLTNVWKHAGAQHTTVRVSSEGGWVRAEINDDGNGLAHRAPEGRGLGIRLLRRRVESLGGCLTVEAVIGKGTTLSAELPLASESP